MIPKTDSKDKLNNLPFRYKFAISKRFSRSLFLPSRTFARLLEIIIHKTQNSRAVGVAIFPEMYWISTFLNYIGDRCMQLDAICAVR